MPHRRDRLKFIGAAGGCMGLLLVMICVLGAVVVQRSGIRALHQQVVQSLETQMVLSRVFSLAQDAETGQRGYVLTGDPAFLSPYDQAKASLGPELDRLDGLLAGHEDQVSDQARLRGLVRLKMQELAVTIQLRWEGRGAEARAIVEDMRGKRFMDGIRTTVAGMQERLSRDTAHTLRLAGAATDRISILVAALLVACLILAVAATLIAVATLDRHLKWITVLAAQRDQAGRDKRATSNFLANMSHEIRTPLTSILGFSRLLHAQPGLSPTVERYNDRVQTAAGALLAVVNDVLDFSKLEAGETRIARTNVEPLRLVEDAMILFEDQAANKGVMVQALVAPEVPAVVSADPDRLRVDVVDTGDGISAEDQALLFERFSQVDGSAARLHGGTGLGLAICKGLVEAMDGQIGVVSAPGEGSRFWFEIPAPMLAGEVASIASDADLDVAAGGRILLVDDNEANRELVSLLLSGLGVIVTVASSGEEAVASADRFPFDLILMDIRMPGMGGVAAMQHIRWGVSDKARTPILAFTAEADVQTAARLRREGFDGHIAKPVSPAELIEAVAYWTSEAARGQRPDARKPDVQSA